MRRGGDEGGGAGKGREGRGRRGWAGLGGGAEGAFVLAVVAEMGRSWFLFELCVVFGAFRSRRGLYAAQSGESADISTGLGGSRGRGGGGRGVQVGLC